MTNYFPIPSYRNQPPLVLEKKRKRGWRRLHKMFTGFAIFWLFTAILLYMYDHLGSLYEGAYFYLRYVQNLFAGCGLRLQCGAPAVESVASPLYLAILVMGRLFIHNLELLAQIIGTVGFGVALLMLVLMVRESRWHGENPLTPIFAAMGLAILFSVDHYVLLHTVSGLETPLAALAVVMLLRAALHPQQKGLQVWLFIAFLLRPEAIGFWIAALLFPRTRQRSFWLPLGIGLFALLVLRLIFFDSLFPQLFWARFGLSTANFAFGFEYIYDILFSFPWILCSPLALLLPQMRRFVTFVLVAAGLWLGCFLFTGGSRDSFGMMAIPVVLPLFMLGMVGLIAILERMTKFVPRWTALTLPWVNPVLVIVSVFWFWPSHTFPETDGSEHIKRWRALGLYLKYNHPKTTIAAVPAGTIGYTSGLKTIDMSGISSPIVLQSGQKAPSSHLSREDLGREYANITWVLDQKPDIIVTSKWQGNPWTHLREEDQRTGFFAEQQLIQRIRAKQAPYKLLSAEILPGVHALLFVRTSPSPPPTRRK